MDFFNTIGICIGVAFIASIFITILLIVIKGLSQFILDNNEIIDKIFKFSGLVGGVSVVILILYMIVGFIIMLVKEIF